LLRGINNYVGSSERAYSLGEEFTDFVLVDKQRQSVILNIERELFKTVYTEYKKLGFSLKHVTRFKKDGHMTCVFVKDP
jgi:hypothetical protein